MTEWGWHGFKGARRGGGQCDGNYVGTKPWPRGRRWFALMLPRWLPARGFYNYILDFLWEHPVHVRLPKL